MAKPEKITCFVSCVNQFCEVKPSFVWGPKNDWYSGLEAHFECSYCGNVMLNEMQPKVGGG